MRAPLALLLAAAACSAVAGESIRFAATPALTPDGATLVFEWRDDLWAAPSTGGVAQALTRHPALDRFPVVSPDGTRVAFMSGRDDTFQTYVMPLTGGVPAQVTFHSEGAVPQDWYPDGRHLLVRGARDSGAFLPFRLLRIDTAEHKAEQQLFDDYADWGRVSPDGASVLLQRDGEDIYRRGYRGSKAATVWQFDPASGVFTNRCRAADGSECRWPLWKPDGAGFYFVHEGAEGCFNLWEKDLATGAEHQRTFLKEYGVIMPAISRDGRVIVFRSGFDFYRWVPGSRAAPARITLTAPGDVGEIPSKRLIYTRATNIDQPGSVDFTEDARQVAFAAGGDLFVMDTTVRDPVPVTSGTAGHDNWASFSPGATNLYFLRDTGERVNIWRASRHDPALPWWRNEVFDLQPVTDDAHGRSRLTIDPTGQRLAWTEDPGSVWVSDLNGSNAVQLMKSPAEAHYDWSPDGRWLACSVQDSDDNRDVWIVSVTGTPAPFNLSRHPNWDGGPAWSPDGRCIAYIGRTYDNEVDIYYAWLRREDYGRLEKETRTAEADAPEGKKAESKGTNAAPAEVQIDFDGLPARVQRIPMPGSAPRNLFWSWDSKALAFQGRIDGKEGTWKVYFPHPGKADLLTTTCGEQARWTAKGLLWAVDEVPAALEIRYPFSLQLERDERAWRRLGFRQMWRALRDGFYDPQLNNVDWDALRLRYEAVLDDLDDGGFTRAANMMCGELNASHMDYKSKQVGETFAGSWKWQTGHLGVRFDPAFAGPGLLVRHVLPDSPASRPLTEIRTGDVVTAINGVAMGPGIDPNTELDGPLPRDVDVTLQRGGSNLQIRLPLINVDRARELGAEALVQEARARVAELSGGRLGYLPITGMKTENLRLFEKEVYDQGFGRDGLVIDVRNNTGGFTADQILSIICQPRHAVTIPRGGEVSYQGGYLGRPFWFKPLVVLCNPYTASNGEIFSHAIRNLGRGKLVGQPTQGAVISTSDRNLLDLGTYRIPHRGWFPQPGGVDMELQGAQPHVVVEDPPGARAQGQDPQLDAAVASLLADMQAAGDKAPAVRYASGERSKRD